MTSPIAHRHAGGARPTGSPCPRRSRGVTLIEALCACSVVATALGVSMGSLRDVMTTQRLRAVAAELESEVQLARSAAVVRSQPVRLTIQPLAGGSCTLIHTGPKGACECRADGNPVCAGDSEVLHANRHEAASGVRFTTADVSIAFSAANGLVTPTATVRLADEKGRALHQIVNVMGRTRTCTPNSLLSGYKRC